MSRETPAGVRKCDACGKFVHDSVEPQRGAGELLCSMCLRDYVPIPAELGITELRCSPDEQMRQIMPEDLVVEARRVWWEIVDSDGGECRLMGIVRELADEVERLRKYEPVEGAPFFNSLLRIKPKTPT